MLKILSDPNLDKRLQDCIDTICELVEEKKVQRLYIWVNEEIFRSDIFYKIWTTYKNNLTILVATSKNKSIYITDEKKRLKNN